MNKRKTNPLLIALAGVLFLFLVGAIFSYLGRQVSPITPAQPALRPANSPLSCPFSSFPASTAINAFTFLTGVVADEDPPRCPRCQSEKLKKLMSNFSRGRSDDDRMEALGDRLENQNFDDPTQLRRFAREMGREMGAETGENMADEMEAMIEEEASGASAMSGGGDDGTIY
jgi:hypothetical protein